MGCCCSKKRKKQEDGQAPLNVQKDKSKFPEETNSTQYSNSEKNPKQAQKTDQSAKTTPTEHGIRSIRKDAKDAGKVSTDRSSQCEDYRVAVPASKPSVASAKGSSRKKASQKSKIKFPEDTNSTQHSESEVAPRDKTEKSATQKADPRTGREITAKESKSTPNDEKAATLQKERQAPPKTPASVKDYKEWVKKMRREFPESTGKTQSDDDERE